MWDFSGTPPPPKKKKKKKNVLHAWGGEVSEASNGFADGQATINCLNEDG